MADTRDTEHPDDHPDPLAPVLHGPVVLGTKRSRRTVAGALIAGAGRALRVATALNGAQSLVYWSRDGGGDVDYVRPEHHTLSVYIEGGSGVRERRAPAARGFAGAICVLPAGHESRWYNDAAVGVLHVYFDDSDLECLGARQVEPLRQVNFGRDPLLHALGRGLVDDVGWSGEAERLVVEQLVRAMLARLVTGGVTSGLARGLSARQLARIETRMRESGGGDCTLEALAACVGLGPRQFTRRYKAATGTTPGQRLVALRVERAQALIRDGRALADVALETGFASQSHLTRRFREHVGTTPGRWRDALQ